MRHVRTLYICILVVNKSISVEVPYTGRFWLHYAIEQNNVTAQMSKTTTSWTTTADDDASTVATLGQQTWTHVQLCDNSLLLWWRMQILQRRREASLCAPRDPGYSAVSAPCGYRITARQRPVASPQTSAVDSLYQRYLMSVGRFLFVTKLIQQLSMFMLLFFRFSSFMTF